MAKVFDSEQAMEQHSHGTRYRDDYGRCLACLVNEHDKEIARLLSQNTILQERCELLGSELEQYRDAYHGALGLRSKTDGD